MNTGPKISNLLAFRFLRERYRGAIFLCAIAGGIFAGPALAQSVPTSIAGCELGMKTHFKVIRNLNNDAINPLDINNSFVGNQCQKNSLSLKNQKEGDAASQKYNADGFGTDPMNGACQLSYWEIRSTYDALQKEYHAYCEKVMELQELGKNCSKKDSTQSPESCIDDLKNKQAEAESKFEDMKTKVMDKFPDALDRRKAKNEEIKDFFEADRVKLLQPFASSISSEYPGGEGFVDFNEYKTYVEANPSLTIKQKFSRGASRGPLIDEQELAQHNIDDYLKSVNEFKTKGSSASSKISGYLADIQKRTQKNDSANGILGAGAQAAPALANLVKQPPAAPAAATVPASGFSGSAASAVLPLAALGAAAANRSGSSSAGATPSATGAGAAATVAPIVATAFDGGRTPAAAGANIKDPLKATEDKKTEAPVIATAATPFSSDGSSRMGQIKHGNKNERAGGEDRTVENHANTGSEAGIIPLGAPHSASRSSTPPNDVTNLLGQMKSLFNFDEGGGPNGPEAAFGGGMPGGGVGLPVGGMPGAVANENAAPYESGPIADEVNPETAATQAESLASDADSLFVRVHKRHVRYEQRGLLVVNLGGIR